jgi:hypothetical protein
MQSGLQLILTKSNRFSTDEEHSVVHLFKNYLSFESRYSENPLIPSAFHFENKTVQTKMLQKERTKYFRTKPPLGQRRVRTKSVRTWSASSMPVCVAVVTLSWGQFYETVLADIYG